MAAQFEPLQRGVWGILPTPFREDLEVDLDSVGTGVDFLRERGATGVVALGVFGEAARLSTAEKEQVLAAVVEAAGELPVVAGIDALATAPATELAARLVTQAPGLRAVMTKAPSADAEVTTEHLRRVSAAAGVGVIAQDYPAQSGVHISASALRQAVDDSEVAVAVKAEAVPSAVAVAHLAPHTNVPVFGGLGGVGLLDELDAGAAGAMTGFSFPEALKACVDAFDRDGFPAAREVYAPWLPIANFEAQLGIALAIRKEILRRRGAMRCAVVRPPAAPLPAVVAARIEQHLDTVPAI
ncbi:dihydrodipicolinate synthase family protein [Egicoccus sp. AB-alg2]|uniref:dihydrodipicolinate synthase family protein n=1 Tax=Egicoccus sp. AB-alg2 TaxID=3242693 RepID=UPI00359CE802